MAIEIASAYVSLSAETSRIPKDVRKALGQAEGAAASSGQSIGQKISSGLGKTLKAGALAGGAAAGAALGMSLKKGFDRLSAIEQSEAKLTGLGHSTESVAKIMDNALGSVKGTAYGLGDAASVAAGMVAAGIKPGKELEGVLKTMGDTAAIAGRDLTDMGLIFQSVAAKGKLQGDDMLQLMSSGIPVLQLLGDELGKTSEEVSDMVSNGEIDFATFEKAMKKGVGGAALEAGKTFKGSMDNMGAAMGRLGEIILKGAFNKAPEVIGRVTEGIDFLGGKIKEVQAYVSGDPVRIEEAFGVEGAINVPPIYDTIANTIYKAQDALTKLAGAGELFFTGDFHGGIREKLGVEEDSKLVDDILNIRDVFVDWGERVGNVFREIADLAKRLAPSFGSIAASLGKATAKVSAATWEALLRIVEALVPVLEKVLVPAFELLAKTMEDHPRLVEAVVFAFAGLKVIKLVSGPLKTIGGIARGASGGFKLLSGALGAGKAAGKGGKIGAALLHIAGGAKSATPAVAKMGGAATKAVGGLTLFGRIGSGLSKVFGLVSRVLGGVAGKLGMKGLLGAVGKVALKFVPFVGWIWTAYEALKWFFTKTETGKKVFEGLKNVLSNVWNWIKDTFVAGFQWAGDKLGSMWDGITGAWSVAWDGITGFISDAWESLKTVWDTVGQPVVDFIVSAWDKIYIGIRIAFNIVKATFEAAWIALGMIWENIGKPIIDTVKSAFDFLWNGLKTVFGWIQSGWDWLWQGLQNAYHAYIVPVIDWIRGAFENLKGWLSTAWNWIKDQWNNLWQAVKDAYGTYIQPVVDWVVSKFDQMKLMLQKAWWTIKAQWHMLWATVKNYWYQYGQPIVDWIVDRFNWFKDKIGEAFDKVKGFAQGLVDSIRNKFNEVIDIVTGVKDRILNAFSDAKDWLVQAGKWLIEGLWNGIKSMGSWITDKLTGWIPDKIKKPFENVLEFGSPSKLFKQYGKWLIEGLAIGVDSMGNKIEKSMVGIADRVAGVDMPTVQVSAQLNDQGLNVEASAQNVSATVTEANPTPSTRYEGGAPPAVQSVEQGTESFEASSEAVNASVQATFDPAVQQADLSMTGFGANVQATATGVVTPQWQGMANNVASAAKGVIAPAFGAVQAGLSNTGARFMQQTTGVMTPMWNAMGANVARVRSAVTDPAMAGIRSALSATGAHFTNSVNGTINPIWTAMGNHVKAVKDGTVLPVFNAVEGGLTKLSGWFGTSVNNIGTAWDRLRAATARPAKFVVETVMNNGIRNAWNAVADLIGEKKMQPVGLGQLGAYASGGVLPGYTPGKDVHHFSSPTGGRLSLSGGEAIMRPEWTRAVGGPKAVAQMNAAARTGSLKKARGKYATDHEHFADGGIWQSLWGAAKTAFPNATLNSSYRPGASGYHGRGAAVDLGGPMQQIANWIYKTYPNSAQLIWGPGPLLYNVGGQKISDQAQLRNQVYAGDLPGHYDHVHWASDGPITSGGKMISMAGGSAGAAMMVSMADMAKEAWDGEIKKIRSYSGPGEFGAMPNKFKKSASEKAWGYLKKQADKMEVGPDAPGGAGAERWRPMIKKAFSFQGEQGTKPRVDALVRQIWTESKGDPNIAQQIVDSNGTGESAGVGLYQVIPTTWEGYRDPRLSANRRDPWAQHNFAVRYFRDRHNWNMGPGGVGRGHGWKSGGVLPENLPAALFDDGGYLQDGQVGQNQSGKPEPVFTHKQWKILKGNIMSAAQAGDLKKLQVNLGVVANGLQQAVAKLDWQEIFGAASKAFNDKFFEDQAADVRSVFGVPDPDSIPAVKAFAEFRENEKKLNEEQAQAAKDSREAATRADSAADKISGAPVPVKAKSESVSVGSQVARTGALVSRALANPNPVSVGAAATSAGQTVNFIVRNEEAAWSEYRKFQAKNSRGRVGAR